MSKDILPESLFKEAVVKTCEIELSVYEAKIMHTKSIVF